MEQQYTRYCQMIDEAYMSCTHLSVSSFHLCYFFNKISHFSALLQFAFKTVSKMVSSMQRRKKRQKTEIIKKSITLVV